LTRWARRHGFTFNAGTYTIVDGAGTAFNQLLGINDGLTAVGYFSTDPMGATLQMSFKESGGHLRISAVSRQVREIIRR
jgi:hypothetical protein